MKNTKPKIALVRQLRKTMTETEMILWHRLKDRADGIIFRRQKAFGPYILDFYCFAARLVVEVDGNLHGNEAHAARDAVRDAYLTRKGLHVYRITAADVYQEADEVADGIWILAEELAAKRKQETPPPRA